MFSCPNTMPGCAGVRPSYMCRSDPQIPVEEIRTMQSVALSMRGSSTSSTATWLVPLHTTAFVVSSLARES